MRNANDTSAPAASVIAGSAPAGPALGASTVAASSTRVTSSAAAAPSAVVDAPATTPALWQVALRGELDIDTAPRVRAELAAAVDSGAPAVMVDLRDVTFMDSSGLSALVECGQHLAARGGSLYLEGASGAVRQVLEITALLDHYRHRAD